MDEEGVHRGSLAAPELVLLQCNDQCPQERAAAGCHVDSSAGVILLTS